ncbi:MAG: hypothetical protein V3U49_01440 [Nitrososphaerales archaeon]
MSAMILPEADANEAIKGISSEIEEVFGKVPIAYINLFRSIYNRDDSCPFAPFPRVEFLLKKVTSSRVCLSCSVRY